MTVSQNAPLLEVRDLVVNFYTRGGVVQASRGVSFQVDYGQTLGIVGESGSGKSVAVQAVMGLIFTPGHIEGGDILFKGRSLLDPAGRKFVRQVRGREIAMIFQDPMTSLNPVFTIGTQITEVLRHHLGMAKDQARKRAMELLDMVDINAPEKRLKQYPHEMSGGMRQRVMIAMALACEPQLIIADEPTTALDVTIRAQVVNLMQDLQGQFGLSYLFIAHDLAVVRHISHRIAIMYAGNIVELADRHLIYDSPVHPYIRALLSAVPVPDPPVQQARQRITCPGEPPNPMNPPKGCRFQSRCPYVTQTCRDAAPVLTRRRPGQTAACWNC